MPPKRERDYGDLGPPPARAGDGGEMLDDGAGPPMGAGGAGGGANKKRRSQPVSRACIFCQRSHLSCDSSRPCKRCVDRGIAHLCREGERQRRRGRPPKYLLSDQFENEKGGPGAAAAAPEARHAAVDADAIDPAVSREAMIAKGVENVHASMNAVDQCVRAHVKSPDSLQAWKALHVDLTNALIEMLSSYTTSTYKERKFTLDNLAGVFEQMILPTLTYVEGLRVKKVNSACCDFLNRTREELLSPAFCMLQILHPDDMLLFLRQSVELIRAYPLRKSFRIKCRVDQTNTGEFSDCIVENSFVFGMGTGILFGVVTLTSLNAAP